MIWSRLTHECVCNRPCGFLINGEDLSEALFSRLGHKHQKGRQNRLRAGKDRQTHSLCSCPWMWGEKLLEFLPGLPRMLDCSLQWESESIPTLDAFWQSVLSQQHEKLGQLFPSPVCGTLFTRTTLPLTRVWDTVPLGQPFPSPVCVWHCSSRTTLPLTHVSTPSTVLS